MQGVPTRSIAQLPHQRSFDDLGTPLHDVTFCVIDLETTGGNRNEDMITEIGAVKVRGGECLGTFQTLVNPGRAIPPQITVLTGLSDVLVAGAPRIESVLGTLIDFVGDSVIVGHNVGFDVGFLRAACQRASGHRSPAPSSTPSRSLVAWSVTRCPTASSARWRLDLRLDHRPSHRALDDALATADLLHLLIERAAGLGVVGLDDLVTLSKLAGHPQAAKLKLTADLPRSPGVYMFHGQGDEILYVGKATNLRQRVRSYFGSDDRRKIGPMLRETQSVAHLDLPDPLTAEVIESRLISRLLPRYNRAGHARRQVLLRQARRRQPLAAPVRGEEPVAQGRAPRAAAIAHDGAPGGRGNPDRGAAASLHRATGPRLHAARRRPGVQCRATRCGTVSLLGNGRPGALCGSGRRCGTCDVR